MTLLKEAEVWKDIKGFEDFYQVSSHGRVRSLDRVIWVEGVKAPHKRTVRGRVLIQNPMYFKNTTEIRGFGVGLFKDGVGDHYVVSNLVAEYFVGPKPLPESIIIFKDGNHQNNYYENLRWSTRIENSPIGSDAVVATVSHEEMDHVYAYLKDGKNLREISKIMNISHATLAMRIKTNTEERVREPIGREGEIWKPIAGYEVSYQISSMGRVKRLAMEQKQSFATGRQEVVKNERLLICNKKLGYWVVRLRNPPGSKILIKELKLETLFVKAFPELRFSDLELG